MVLENLVATVAVVGAVVGDCTVAIVTVAIACAEAIAVTIDGGETLTMTTCQNQAITQNPLNISKSNKISKNYT